MRGELVRSTGVPLFKFKCFIRIKSPFGGAQANHRARVVITRAKFCALQASRQAAEEFACDFATSTTVRGGDSSAGGGPAAALDRLSRPPADDSTADAIRRNKERRVVTKR